VRSRRSFSAKVGAIVATIALAPEIAFRVALPIQLNIDFRSVTWTAVVECQTKNLIIENFSG